MSKERQKPENPSVSKHAVYKYIDRIVNPKNMDRNEYYTLNNERLQESIKEMFSYSEFVFRGQVLKNCTQSFYMHRDVVFVADDVNDNIIITIFKVSFPFTEKINQDVIKGLKEEILSLESNMVEEKAILDEITDEIASDTDVMKVKIQTLEDELNLLRNKIKANDLSIRNARDEFSILHKKVDGYAQQLLGNTSFKKEAEKNMKEWGLSVK